MVKRVNNASDCGGGAGAPMGNQNGIALKDAKLRQQAYNSYCDHLATGKSKKSWFFSHPEYSCSWATMDKYIEDTIEFNPLKKEQAMSKGFGYWESVVEDSAKGKNKHANTATLQMLMRNKYDWDKKSDQIITVTPEQNKQLDSLVTAIRQAQLPEAAESKDQLNQH